jgi:uncharacterized protein YecT (DUF1311 family)
MRFLKTFVIVFFLCLSSNALLFADDEHPTPGLDACLAKAEGRTFDLKDCYQAAYEYWDIILNDKYKEVKAQCSVAPDPKECSQTLLSAQRGWLAYRDGFSTLLYDPYGGTIARMEAIEFLYTATKNQALLLDRVTINPAPNY